jgi:glucosylceramidase
MKLQKLYRSTLCLLLVSAVSLLAQNAYLRTTIERGDGTTEPFCIPWVDSGVKAGTAWASTSNYIEITPATTYQTIMGWGGTVQERHWVTMSVLSAAGKDSVMRALFDTSGCNINYLRCPIGCCDFDINEAPISLDETAGDYSMANFSLHRDSTRKIPLIKMAQAINPDIKFWGCPWSPPRWMHDNGDYATGNMKSDAQTQTAYALYLEKFITGYKTAGINVDWICCQNEPTITDGGYPKCGWANSLEQSFYKNYMIPRFKQDNISTKIFLGVFCCGNYADWITYIMNDATVAGDVGITSHSYQGEDWGTQAVAAYPSIPFFETEAPFGPWPTPTDPLQLENWARGTDLFNNIFGFMNKRASVYTIWNMVNDETTKSGFNWMQTIAIRVNSTTKQVTYLPWFYAFKHFAYYVKQGAKAVKYTVNGATLANVVAFTNPNGDIILVMYNINSTPFALTVKVGNTMYKASLPPNSFNTLKIVGPTAVQDRKQEKTALPALNNARICNATLYFTLPAKVDAQEVALTLTDLQGQTIWSGSRTGSALRREEQVFAIRSTHDLAPGTYLLAAKIKSAAGAVTAVEKKVAVGN